MANYVIDENMLARLIEESEKYQALCITGDIEKWDKYEDTMRTYLEEFGENYDNYEDYSYSLLDVYATEMNVFSAGTYEHL